MVQSNQPIVDKRLLIGAGHSDLQDVESGHEVALVKAVSGIGHGRLLLYSCTPK